MTETPFQIGVLVTGRLRPEVEARTPGGVEGVFERWLAGCGASIRLYDVIDGVFPEGVREADGWLVTGSPAAVYEDHGWIPPLEAFVRAAADHRPVLGICFGHQLVAQAFGGRVVKSERGWGLGLHRYDVFEPQPWLGARPTLDLLAMHQDQVVEPPPGAKILAGNAHCPIAMLEIGARVLGVQGHPEFDPHFAGLLLEFRRENLGPGVEDAEKTLNQPRHRMAEEIMTWMRAHA